MSMAPHRGPEPPDPGDDPDALRTHLGLLEARARYRARRASAWRVATLDAGEPPTAVRAPGPAAPPPCEAPTLADGDDRPTLAG